MNQEKRQSLFDHLSKEHNLHLLESELDEIINIVSCENDAIKTLVDDYERRIKTATAELAKTKDIEKRKRLQVKASCYRTIVTELNQI